MDATTKAPRTTSRSIDLHTLRNARQVDLGKADAALERLARKAGMEAAEHRLRYYGAEWMECPHNAGWELRDVDRAFADLERNLGRPLSLNDRIAFRTIAVDLIHDLV